MYAIGRHINGISINGWEFMLDAPNGNTLMWHSEEEAKKFLFEHGGTQEDLDDGLYDILVCLNDGKLETI